MIFDRGRIKAIEAMLKEVVAISDDYPHAADLAQALSEMLVTVAPEAKYLVIWHDVLRRDVVVWSVDLNATEVTLLVSLHDRGEVASDDEDVEDMEQILATKGRKVDRRTEARYHVAQVTVV